RRHGPHCLVQRHGPGALYSHRVLEAKRLGPAGGGGSLGSAFIDHADLGQARGKRAEELKQDGELKALARPLPRSKREHPQLAFVLALDGRYACGTVFALARELGWSFVVTFKEGRLPALWQDFRGLLPACPGNRLRREWADGLVQKFRWVNQ